MSDKIDISGMTDIGKVRSQNQDALLIIRSNEQTLPSWCESVVAVFDGASGIQNGDIAARKAAEYFTDIISRDSTTVYFVEQIGPILEEAILETNRRLLEYSGARTDSYATTIAVVIFNNIKPETIHCGAIGDSLIYLANSDRLQRIFPQDSYLTELSKRGFDVSGLQETWGQVMTQVLGLTLSVKPHITHADIRKGHRIIVCTDGLTGSLDDSQIEQIIINNYDSAHKLCEELISVASEKSSEDNITVVVAYIK
jgi:protein phosphatase